MEQHEYDAILEQVDTLLETMKDAHESELYLVIEIAHQMRDELVQAEPDDFNNT